jgi:CheY-like chemotaxis protein
VKKIQTFTTSHRGGGFTPVDLNRLVNDVVELTKPQWQDKPQQHGITISVDTELGDIAPIAGNIVELSDVFTNIVFNAVEAMPEGGTITIKTWLENDDVCVSFGDTGVGMTEEIKEKIFDPFFTTKEVPAMGMGLSTAYGTIQRHSGNILVDTEIGQGSQFTLKLPKYTEKQVQAEITVTENKIANILIIDDEEYVRDILRQFLIREGHYVAVAEGARKGFELFHKRKFDLVITDLGLPEIPGYEIAKQIKATHPNLPIIMVTGWGDDPLDEEKSQYVDAVINKPFQRDRIIQAVQNILN